MIACVADVLFWALFVCFLVLAAGALALMAR